MMKESTIRSGLDTLWMKLAQKLLFSNKTITTISSGNGCLWTRYVSPPAKHIYALSSHRSFHFVCFQLHGDSIICSKSIQSISKTKMGHQQREPSNFTAFVAALRARNNNANQIPHVFPRLKLVKKLEIYHLQACQTLVDLVSTQSKRSICPNGGSATAGSGLKNRHQLYSRRLVDYLKGRHVTQSNTIVNTIHRGYAARTSLHSTLMRNNYISPNTNILLWEFATRYYEYNFENDHVSNEYQFV